MTKRFWQVLREIHANGGSSDRVAPAIAKQLVKLGLAKSKRLIVLTDYGTRAGEGETNRQRHAEARKITPKA